MRHLGSSGYSARLVGRPIAEDALSGRPWQLRYARARYAAAAKAGRGPVIFWGGARARIREALASRGSAVLGAVDVPPTETHSLTDVNLLGQPTRFTHGLVQLAMEMQVPIVVFSMGLSADARRQLLRIDQPLDVGGQSIDALMQTLADRLTERVAGDPAAWSLWAWLGAFFGERPATPVPPVID
jgi:lauroyl/myristoyl acyltransferase